MSVIIRLQGLAWSASAMNIRHFFTGLNIPAGGVHIIGGDGGDAFIAFSSDDDARMAMKKNLCPLNGTPVQLFLSSKSEMQSVIDAARSGSSTAAPSATAAAAAATIPLNIPQAPQRQQFSNLPGMFPTENQNQNNTSNAMAGQVGDFNQQMQGQFAKNDWQGFQMYGGRMDEQNQQMSNQFQHNQRLAGNQMDGRFPNILGANDRGHFGMQQDKGFPLGGPPFYDASGQMQQPVAASAGLGGMHQPADMSGLASVGQKQPLFDDNVGPRSGPIPAPSAGSDNPAAVMPNLATMGRGQLPFPGQLNMGPNRNMFNANMGRLPGKDMASNILGNLSAGRGPANDGILGRGSAMDDKSLGGMDDMGPADKFSNQFANEGGSDGRKSDMMDWGVGDDSPDTRFMGSQKPFDQDVQEDKPNLNREKMGLDSRSFQQFPPFRNDPDRARINRVMEVVERSDPNIDADESRQGERPERPVFPGRDIRTGSRFGPIEPESRFHADKFPDRSGDRFKNERIPPEESLPSTKYPPEPDSQVGPGDSRPPGRFPPIRGRNDDVRYPVDDRPFPPDHRFPNEDRRLPNRDQAFPPDHERFPEGDFPPVNRGYLPDDRRHAGENRRFPPAPDANRFHPDEGRFPPEVRPDAPPDRMRSEEFGGRRPGDNPFAPDDIRFREREDELRRRDPFGRGGRRGLDDRFTHDRPAEGRPNIRPGFRNFEEGEDLRRFPPDRRFPPERPKWNEEEEEEEFRAPPRGLDERRGGMPRWERERFDDWPEDGERFPPVGGPRGHLPEDADFPGMGRPVNMDIDGPVDMDQRTGRDMMNMRGPPDGRRGPSFEGRGGPGIEGVGAFPDPDGLRGPGMEGFRAPLIEGRGHPMDGFRPPLIEGRGHPMEGARGRGMDGMRGRGMEGMRGRGGPGMDGRRGGPGLANMDENSFDYGHGSVGRGRPPLDDDEFGESVDFDNRFQGPGDRGGMFDRSHRGRGDVFFNRGRPGPPMGRGRGLDVDRRFEEAPPEGRFNMDVDARNVGGRPDGPPIRPGNGDSKMPDFSVKPGSGKGLLGDAPVLDRPTLAKPEIEKKEIPVDSARRDFDNRPARRSNDRDRDHRSTDRRGRDREDRRSGERSRYRYERDRSDRRRSRSRERGGRDNDSRRSRDRSSSTKKDHDGSKSDPHKSDHRKRCIHMKNIPAVVTYKEVRRFFQPIDVPFDGMKIINDKQGQRTGDVFVQFRHAEDAARAVRRNGEKLNGKIVSISLCTDEEFATPVDPFPQNKKDNAPTATESQKTEKDDKIRYIVQVKNLPLNITKQDIAQFFKGLTIENNGEAVYIEYNQGGIATGNGIVELKSDYDYKKALTQDGSLLGTISIRVFPGKKEDADELKKKQQETFHRAPLHNVGGPRMMQPQLQGQPPRPQGQPLRPQGQPLRPQGQPPRQPPPRPQGIIPRPQGQPPRPDLIGGPRHGLGPQAPSPVPQQPSPNQPTRASTPSESPDTVCVHIQGLPLLATPQDIREFFSDCQIALRGINIAHDSRGKPLGEGFVEFKFKSEFEKAIKKDKTSLGRHIVAVKPIGKKEMMERLDNARGLPAQQGSQQAPEDPSKNQGIPPAAEKQQNSSQNSQQGQAPPGQNPQGPKTLIPGPGPNSAGNTQGVTVTASGSKSIPAGVLNKSWYYVRCQNFPADISIAEILTFFHGFRPIGESIRLHYSSDGKPTGNAVVGFLSPEEAQRALQRLSMKVCRQNIVTLHPA